VDINRKPTQSDKMMENNNQKPSQLPIAGAILIVGMLIAGAIFFKGNTPVKTANNNNPENVAVKNTAIQPISKDEHIFGNPNAKIMIVEYSDTECPFCKMFHATMHKVVAQNNGNVAWVYRHYPIEQLHPKAFHEAEAMECAWAQGGNEAFWKYTDQIYTRTQSNNKLDVAELPKIAQDIGLDLTTFNTCLLSGKYADKINAQIIDAQNAGARGTPASYIVVDGKVVDEIPGAQSLEGVQAIIDALK